MSLPNQKKKIDVVQHVGVIICIGLLAFSFLARKKNPAPVQQNLAETSSQETSVVAPVSQTPAASPEETASAADVPQENAASQFVPLPPLNTPRNAPAASAILLERKGEAEYRIDPMGQGVVSVSLPNYSLQKNKAGEASGPVVLGRYDYPFLALSVPAAGAWKYAAPEVNDARTVASVARTSADGVLQIRETWDVSSSQANQVLYRIVVRNTGVSDRVLSSIRIEGGAMPSLVGMSRKTGRGESSGGLFLGRAGRNVTEYTPAKLNKKFLTDRDVLAATPTSWTAVHSKYFVQAMWRRDGAYFSGVEAMTVPGFAQDIPAGASPEDLQNLRCHVRGIVPDVTVPAGQEVSLEFEAYIGPKKYDALYDLGNGLDRVMQMDMFFFWHPAWMGHISRWLLKLLVWISHLFPASIGWGLAVILLTLLLKLLFLPLSHKSMVSMRKMAALKPQMDKIKEQYKDNPQLMFQKQRELQQANGVSTMGGCLPMLLQIPVFFALFNMFRNAVELRQASFLWAADLSLPDTLAFSPEALPIRPFAILMAAGMVLQQKMSPNADPSQSRMMMFMSVFFAFIFYGMPSALTLYLTVTYVLGCLQTWMVNRLMPLPAEIPAGKK